MTSDELVFLEVEDVEELHAAQLEVFGGGSGLRDRGLLESAVAQPQASFGGNKRAGLLSALVFLDLNGITIASPSDALYELTMGVAEGRLAKSAIAAELERIAKRAPSSAISPRTESSSS